MKVTLDAPLVRNLRYNRATDRFIQWIDRSNDKRQVYGLSFASPDAADGFQQWLDYAANPPPTAALFVSASSSSSTLEVKSSRNIIKLVIHCHHQYILPLTELA